MLVGTYRFVHRDSNDNTIAELLEKHDSEFGGVMGTPQSDPQKMPKVKKVLSTIMREDDKLVLMIKPDVLITVVTGTTGVRTLRIPVTFRNRRSGVVYEKTLVPNDFTDKKDITLVGDKYSAGIWYDLEQYQIPAQSEMKLGHALQDVRVDSALNLQRDIQTS